MDNLLNTNWYRAWRRSQAYMLPMSEDGAQRANIKAEGFQLGYEAGLKAAATKLEAEHSKVKKQHSFFLAASRIIKELSNEI